MERLTPIPIGWIGLRPLDPGDRSAVERILCCPVTMAEVIGGPLTPEAAGAWLHQRIEDEEEHGVSVWGIEHLGALVGLCGFVPTAGGDLDLAYVVHHEHQGLGIASDAAHAAVRAARAAGRKVFATIRPENVASIRVTEAAGLRRTDETLECKPGLLVFRSAE